MKGLKPPLTCNGRLGQDTVIYIYKRCEKNEYSYRIKKNLDVVSCCGGVSKEEKI